MSIIICNIGNRDIVIKRDVLPDELHYLIQDSGRKSVAEREFAQALIGRPELYPSIELPMIRTILNDIPRQEIQHIFLIASNQSDPKFSPSDTIISAEIARNVLIEQFNINQVTILPLSDISPADYDKVLTALETMLQPLAAQFPTENVYLELTGGTPAMSTGLMIAGTEIFQNRAFGKYVSHSQTLPDTLAIGKRLLAKPLRESLLTLLKTHQYQAVLSMWQQYSAYFQGSHDESLLIEALLHHAKARLNLDLVDANHWLQNRDQLVNGTYRSLIQQLRTPLASFNDLKELTLIEREHVLAELLHIATIRLQNGNYAEFLTIAVHFWELTLRLQCLRFKMQFVTYNGKPDNDGPKLDPEWALANGINLDDLKSGQNYLQKLLKILHPNDAHVEELRDYAKVLQPLIELRNKVIHRVQHVTNQELDQVFGDHTTILPTLSTLYQHIIGVTTLPINPYQLINETLFKLIDTH